MKIWLDDRRDAPEGWVRMVRVNDVIEALRTTLVTELSLDYDLDDTDGARKGVEVLAWIYDQIKDGGSLVTKLHIHTGNPYGAALMALYINAIEGGPEPSPEALHFALLAK